jgi:phosphatidylserine/phosphatidylglycerophosphate/cardiolipin synthase-like enzyme/regulation of enolase protein 1 (concanavalin A-like superfamily)
VIAHTETAGRRRRPGSGLLTTVGLCLLITAAGARPATAADKIYFPAIDNTINLIVQYINAETERIDISTWYLTEHAISIAIANRHQAGVPIRIIGDRGSIFEIDPNTRTEYYYLANLGVPIRLRFNPTWYPEIDHWKMAIFKHQGVVEFGSANWDTFELAPWSSDNYTDETVMFSDDPVIFKAFLTKFDRMWNDTTPEPESQAGGPPYLKDWPDACDNEPTGCDFYARFPQAPRVHPDTRRLEGDNPMPPDLIWGQGPDFNNRLVQEINNEPSFLQFVIYRLTVSNITQALLNRSGAGVGMQLIVEPGEYLNRKWPEFWLTHANLDSLWAAGIPMKQRKHVGLTHMKTIVTSAYATNASSNYSAAWQRDHDYFVSATQKPTIYSAIKNRVTAMWNDSNGFEPFVPQPPDAPGLSSPGSGASSVSQTASLVWNLAPFATNFDVYLGLSSSGLTRMANVPAQLNNNPPSTYSWTPPSALCSGTTYYWQVVSRTNATPKNGSLVAASPISSFTTSGANNGCSGLPGGGGGGGGGGGTSNVPAPWVTQDVGSVGAAGSANYSNGTFTVSGAGGDIWGTADAFRYVYQPVSGDTQIVARVVNMQNTNSFAKSGIMLRESLGAGSAHVLIDLRPDGGIEFMTRSSSGGQTTFIAGGAQAFPAWLKLARSGNTVTGYSSANGSTWTTIGSTNVSMGSNANVGMIVNSHNTAVLNTSTFDNVGVGGAPPPPPPPPPSSVPAPWTNQDVGSTGTAGSATYASPVFTVKGAGADIWGTSDAFQYVLQPFSGDGQIVARVNAMQNTSVYAKAGVMLRQSTSAGSAHVILDMTPNGGVEFMTRSTSGGQTAFIAGASRSFPSWLKLTRAGGTVTGYVSSDGSSWSLVGSTSTSISSSATIGLVVTSHDPSVLNTATFDNVAVSSGTPPPPPPPSAPNIVFYAGDVAGGRHGSWSVVSDSTAAGGSKLATPDAGVANTNNPLASPSDYVDVSFSADAGVPYTIWLRMQAAGNSKLNDAVWVQFSDARANGSAIYPINSTSGLLVNLATDGSGSSLNSWGWQNTAYWLSQPTTVTFASSGAHTLRIQIREDGVAFDQIVLSPGQYLNGPPGGPTNDPTIVSKP